MLDYLYIVYLNCGFVSLSFLNEKLFQRNNPRLERFYVGSFWKLCRSCYYDQL